MDLYIPDEIWFPILHLATDNFESITYLLLVNKQFYRIINEMINKGILNKFTNRISKYLIVHGEFPQAKLVNCLKSRGFTMFHILENFYLHGLCKKWNKSGIEIEYMEFNRGKLISHTIKKEKTPNKNFNQETNNRRIYTFKKIVFYPSLKFETFNESGKTNKIITSSYLKTFDMDNVQFRIEPDNKYYIQNFQQEMLNYNDLKPWIFKEEPKP